MNDAVQPPREPRPFPIVGVGASAGGFAPTKALLRDLGRRPGVAVVVVQHLAPTHESLSVELFAKSTELPVETVHDGQRVEVDHAYVLPPGVDVHIAQGVLYVTPRAATGLHRPIDELLESLAEDRGVLGVGVVLSGTGADGSRGVQAIKAEGGITFAQDASAEHGAMPQNAIATGCVDVVLPPEEIARDLVRLGQRTRASSDAPIPGDIEAIQRIVRSLRKSSGVDFSHYRQTTLARRVRRRAFLQKRADLADYASFVESDPAESEALTEDVLIHVTSFFRDPEVFATLKASVFPRLLLNRPPTSPVRVWVPGCSTGEEAYSIAMSLTGLLEETGAANVPIKVFGTDLSRRAIARARAGLYPETISTEVSAERLDRFFVHVASGYRVASDIRDACVFATQDVTRDPPLSRMDLISCRNLMIYLGPVLQQRLLPAFHFSLNDPGFLVLGSSESIGTFSGFSTVDSKQKIFARSSGARRAPMDLSDRGPWAASPLHHELSMGGPPGSLDVRGEADRAVLAQVAASGVIVSDDLAIVEFRGQPGQFLEPAPGAASLGLLRMARDELRVPLHQAIEDARASGRAARRPGTLVSGNGAPRRVDVDVIPFFVGTGQQRFFVVLFGAREAEPAPPALPTNAEGELRVELASTREYLQSIIDQHQVANEELRAANEEVVSASEELQSTNEELQTAKEELQAANEELRTINDEMRERNADASRVNDDLTNVLGSVALPIIMLGRNGTIRRFTPAAAQVLSLIPTDVGRPLTDITPKIRVPELQAMIKAVLDDFTPQSRTVQREDGRWVELTVRPYRTADNRVDGTVISVFDVDALTNAKLQLAKSRDYAESVVDTVRESLVVLDVDLRVRSANRAFYETFQRVPEATVGRVFVELDGGAWSTPELRAALFVLAEGHQHFLEFRAVRELPRLGARTISFSGRRIAGSSLILLAMEDITENARATELLEKSEAGLRTMLATAAESILMSDANGVIVFANRMAETTFGYDAGALVGTKIESLVPEATLAARADDHGAARSRGFTAQRRDGTELPVEIGFSVMEGSDGPLVVSFINDMTATTEAAHKAAEHHAKIQEMAFEAATAEERERRRIAADLHDGVGQTLALARIKLTTELEHTAKNRAPAIEEALSLLAQAITAVRTLTVDLSPPILYDLGLRAALSWLAEEIELRHGIHVELTDDGIDHRVDDATSSLAFRAARELLVNVLKHAKTRSARVSLRRVGRLVELGVSDDGVGFDPDAAKGGFGLFSVREQILRLGGTFDVTSAPGKGTSVRLGVPISASLPPPPPDAA